MKKIKKGTIIEFYNHAGKQTAKYIKEIKNGAYTDMLCYLNSFNKPTLISCFRYQGVIQSSYKVK